MAAGLGATGALGLLGPGPSAAQGESQAADGVREALSRGVAAAVAALGRPGGFLGDPRVRIPLPGFLADAGKLMRRLGQGDRVDELETAMNRAAERAVPMARQLLVDTVRSISVEDALRLVRGGDTAVTDFFAGKTRVPLTRQLLPVVTQATRDVDLAQRYNALAARLARAGVAGGDLASVEEHVTAKTLDALYLKIGDEERRLRQDPVRTGSALLKQVFGR